MEINFSLWECSSFIYVRFRTPIKDPIDLVFIFWAIAIGIANGVSYFSISTIGSIFIAIVLFLMVRVKDNVKAYLLIIEVNLKFDIKSIQKTLKNYTRYFELKSHTVTKGSQELIFEIELKNDNLDILNDLKNIDIFLKTTLIKYSGDVSSV